MNIGPIHPHDRWKLDNGPYEDMGIPAELLRDDNRNGNYASAKLDELTFRRRLGLPADEPREAEEA